VGQRGSFEPCAMVQSLRKTNKMRYIHLLEILHHDSWRRWRDGGKRACDMVDVMDEIRKLIVRRYPLVSNMSYDL
jgi:hypothetical protein